MFKSYMDRKFEWKSHMKNKCSEFLKRYLYLKKPRLWICFSVIWSDNLNEVHTYPPLIKGGFGSVTDTYHCVFIVFALCEYICYL